MVVQVLLSLLEGREPWERDRVAQVALAVLRRDAVCINDGVCDRLRTRLIELGYDRAAYLDSE
jgi:hypothetical protein